MYCYVSIILNKTQINVCFTKILSFDMKVIKNYPSRILTPFIKMHCVRRTLGSIWQCAPMLQLLIDVFSAILLCSPTMHRSSIWVDFMLEVGWMGVSSQLPVTESHRCLIWKIVHFISVQCSLHEVSCIYISVATANTSVTIHFDGISWFT